MPFATQKCRPLRYLQRAASCCRARLSCVFGSVVFRFFFGDVFQEDVCALAVCRERDVVDVAETQERVDVRLVRLARQRVAQEDDAMDVFRRDERADLLVAAERAGHHGLDIEAERVLDERAGRARGDEVELREQFLVMPDKFEHLVLLFVVSDECDGFHRRSLQYDLGLFAEMRFGVPLLSVYHSGGWRRN